MLRGSGEDVRVGILTSLLRSEAVSVSGDAFEKRSLSVCMTIFFANGTSLYSVRRNLLWQT